ncbi:MAG TPA: hypothetical protein VET48_14185 [Steroidobacteraceae bacterium]|nr:hypothetical protein [Steroidobacteraceae bacterium]
MNLTTVEVAGLLIGAALLIALAVRLRKRLHAGDDFLLGRRRLDTQLGGFSIAMNSVPLTWLLILVATAYAVGKSAIWLALALVGGVILSGWNIAPRLRARAQMQQAGTISQLLADDAGEKTYAMLMRSMALIAVISLSIAVAAQLQLVSGLLADSLAISQVAVAAIVVFVLGITLVFSGFWITAIGDLVQFALFVGVGVICTIATIVAGYSADNTPVTTSDWFGDQHGLLIVSFLVGVQFLLGYAMGQSPLLARFMACKDDADLFGARKRALLMTGLTTLLALAIGWSVRALGTPDALSVDTFMDTLSHALSPGVTTLLKLSMVVAMIVAMNNGLLAVASHLANDLRRSGSLLSLLRCRLGLAVAVLLVAGFAIYLPQTTPQGNFDRMIFGWHAMGAAFGPIVIVRLTGKRVRPGSTLGAIWSGFLLTIVFHLMPDTPGDLLERSLPFTASLGIALSGGERRRDPDRADRGERTIHDRLPI